MLSIRGDAHKFYLKLKKAFNQSKSIDELNEIIEIKQIKAFYYDLSNDELTYIRYRMIKEQNGTGMIPILVSTIPWLGLMFSKPLQNFLFKTGSMLWFWFLLLYTLVNLISIYINYSEKAWSSVHIEIIEDILKSRDKDFKSK